MRRLLAAVAMVLCAVVSAIAVAQTQVQAEWFTVAGNPLDPAVDTVQVDPVTIGFDGDGDGDSRPLSMRMNLRVNRSVERINWKKGPYRSYESQVVFDCQARRGAYLQVRYYMQPLWQGGPHNVADYRGNPRPMLFRDMEPNPVSRIVRPAG